MIAPVHDTGRGANQVLVMSSIDFAIMFAVWLGGFILPPLFAYTKLWSGFPSSTFFVLFILTAICAIWMHVTVVGMLHEQSPALADHFDTAHISTLPSGATA